jgi:hypothetical protein
MIENIRDRDWKNAVHETGHALGARLVGAELGYVFIGPMMVKVEGKKYRQMKMGLCHTKDPFPDCGGRCIEYYLLGHAAELEFGLYRHSHRSHRQDYALAINYMKNQLRLTQQQAKKEVWKPAFDRHVRRARRLAHTHRDWIEGVAKLLFEKRKLTGADVPQLAGRQEGGR